MQRDVASLSDHAAYLTNKIQFLLDALLGIVTLDQNNVIKIFSVARWYCCRRHWLLRSMA